jgi:uncharacterized protein (TIGR00299 family) protein
MRALYFDCFAGVSGDMIIGALIDLGLDLQSLNSRLDSLGLHGYTLRAERVKRAGLAASKFNVDVSPGPQPHRTLVSITDVITNSELSDQVKQRSVAVFERLAEAEARVHGVSRDEVHFHEVGALDSIIDIVGAMVGFELLGIDRFYSSAICTGFGHVETAHGRLPVPAPATAELLKGVPAYGGEIQSELATPTGVAILTSLCESFGPMPPLTIEQTGYGAGSRDPERSPNVLRLFVGTLEESPPVDIVVLETNIDDMNPQAYEFVMERAFALGALDVYLTQAQMKKNRPGVLLTALCRRQDFDAISTMLLADTTSLGLRYYNAKRRVLERRVETVETEYGPVRVKVALDGARALHFQPEYEDCVRVAAARGVPLIEVQSAASAAYRTRRPDKKAKTED